MKILTLNCGSSSIKYKFFDSQKEISKGLIERIGERGSQIENHAQGIQLMLRQLQESGKIRSVAEIDAIGHRVVHGGELAAPCLIDYKTLQAITEFSPLAPLHNPHNLRGILEMQKVVPALPQVAVFDTAFYQKMPEYAKNYALPLEFSEKHRIKRYGFHGTSHQYVSQRTAEFLGEQLENLNLITCHLGSGCSITAIQQGTAVDTSMGFTPLEGLVMGTRSGNLDPGALIYILNQTKMTPEEIDALLNKKSGLLGISGVSNDMRTIIEGCERGDKRCKLAYDIFCYSIRKYLGAYTAVLGKLDAIVFTAGIGENQPVVRATSANIESLGIEIDEEKNKRTIRKEGIISSNTSKIKVLVIPTDEEKMIAMQTRNALGLKS